MAIYITMGVLAYLLLGIFWGGPAMMWDLAALTAFGSGEYEPRRSLRYYVHNAPGKSVLCVLTWGVWFLFWLIAKLLGH